MEQVTTPCIMKWADEIKRALDYFARARRAEINGDPQIARELREQGEAIFDALEAQA